EAYRKIRNTARYLLGIIADFDPAKEVVAYTDMPEMERYMMARLNHLIENSLKAYEDYEFYMLYQAVHKFCVLDMSAFYLDVSKDTLYAELPGDIRRRSIQTVAYKTLDALMRLMAPVISFTAEEIYSYIPKSADAPCSVQLLDMPTVDAACFDEALEAKWNKILELREVVSKELELARQEKTIGHSLDAAIALYADDETFELLDSVRDELAKIFIVSKAVLADKGTAFDDAAGAGLAVKVAAADGIKCERCWIYSDTVGESEAHPTLCRRCAEVMAELPPITE
ncbi:MAG: class I tRNA ligase family protein, partial [Firmicutes bacterium]|nr:class I tRNA ligase family protein [Bacillota bacterium]